MTLFRPLGLLLALWSVVIVSGLPSSSLQIRAMEDEPQSHPEEHAGCDKSTCASIVSYCLIEGACSCNPSQNCSCCADCALCLGDLYMMCCDCVGLRRGMNYTADLPTITSTVSMLDHPAPELFNLLIKRKEPTLRYSILQFPVIEELLAHRHRHRHGRHQGRHRKTNRRNHVYEETVRRPMSSNPTSQEYWDDIESFLRRTNDVNLRCSVAYFDDCLPLHRCQLSCDRMGATYIRWFHNGCCECAGETCVNYGNMYPNCMHCEMGQH